QAEPGKMIDISPVPPSCHRHSSSALARLSGHRLLTQDGDGAKPLTLLDLGFFCVVKKMYTQSHSITLRDFQRLDSLFDFMYIQSMASIQKVKAGRHTYYRIVESRRVNGKPRPIPLLHLGTADQLLNRLLTTAQPRCTLRSYQHGDVAALKAMADRLGLLA